jgi:hypothetical protein
MTKKCSICSHRNHDQIDQLILKKTPYRTIAEKYRIKAKDPIQAIKNHVRYKHIPKQIQTAQEKSHDQEEVRQGLKLQSCAQDIYDLAMDAARMAKNEDLRAFGGCIGPAIKVLELLNKPGGEDNPPGGQPKESGFIAGYMKRAGDVYAKESPPPQ